MPQLDTSTWLITIMSMITTLFILIQLKFTKHNFHPTPTPDMLGMTKQPTPWEMKWTKIYLPHSSLLR
uniref:ATP synthase complex subunit 8 n=1 Tax=Myrmecophaga tridactyla TaxID=71006 RepID=A0A0S2LML7_MYRTR|nr:ATP synthase F0 subunit 8 [Myrmecophaga tridactyla]ALO62535.1 ATP synthase F0 subunit 8 [Myrmecophaga tridactyla]AYV89939.1 ATP synthase F0 subunit 8 [Myrmecophaga tridactyla]